MTKEQEEAIESLKQLINIRKNKAGQIKYDNCICSTTAIETVLNMLKEKDEEIEKLKKENEHWKNGFERELEDNRENTCELLKQDLIIRKKDRQIDFMAKYIADIDNEDICFEIENKHCTKNMDYDECEDCIKQDFERKVEDENVKS